MGRIARGRSSNLYFSGGSMSISGLSSRPSLFEKDKFYLTRLDEIRQNEENKARERAKTMCLSTSTDPNMEAVELVEAVVEAFEAASQAAFSDKLLKEVGVAIQSMRESRRRPLLGAIGWCLRRSRPFGHRGQGAALCLRESNLRAALVCLARTSDRSGCQALARAIGYVRFANCLRRERSQNV